MPTMYICKAKDVCKREDCFHAKPHEYSVAQGCGNGAKCYRLDDAIKANPTEGLAPSPVCEEVKE